MKVLDPVDTGPYVEEARALQRHVWAKIIQQIADWRGTDLDAVDGRSGTEASAVRWIDAGPDARDEGAGAEAPGEASVKPSAHPGASEPGG